jgi:hypothetical protein
MFQNTNQYNIAQMRTMVLVYLPTELDDFWGKC